jgi:short-subunit dehydrogenase
MDLKQKTAVVTGAASGIGKELAIELAKHGSTLALLDVNEDGLQKAAEEVRKHAPDSIAEICDVSEAAKVKQVVRTIYERYGAIDILVNCAGIMIVKLFNDLTEDEFNRQINVNLLGTISFTRSVVPVMREQGRGVIIIVAGNKVIVPGTTAYVASKGALYSFSESLHLELKDRGIHVGVILPTGVRTGIFGTPVSKLGEYYRDQCRTSPSVIAKSIRIAIEKERFETITPWSSKIVIAMHDFLSGPFRKYLLRRLRPYFE